MTQSRQQGFTLIELMITVTVVAILASIAYPSYQNFVLKSRRESARADLIENVHKIENYYAKQKKFSGYTETLTQNKSTDFFTLAGNYEDNHYRLTATPTTRNSNESNRIVYDSIDGITLCSDASLTSCNPF